MNAAATQTATAHPLLLALRDAADAAARAASIEAKLYGPGHPDVPELSEDDAGEAHAMIDRIVRSLLRIEGVSDRVTLERF